MIKAIVFSLFILIGSSAETAWGQQKQDVEIVQDELTLQGRLMVAANSNLADGVVLITHGTLAHMDMELIASMQNLLAERGVNSLVHSLSLGVDRRTGMYDCTVPFRGSRERDHADIAAWVRWLEAQGAGAIAMMGHSRGAVQTARFAAETMPDSLSSVVMLAPSAGKSYEDHLKAYDNRHKSSIAGLLKVAEGMIEGGKGDQLMDVPGIMYCDNAKVTAGALSSYYGPRSSQLTKDVISDITVPVLVVLGREDDVVGDVASHLAPVVDGERVRLSSIEGAGHFFYDFDAEDAADIIADFVKEQAE